MQLKAPFSIAPNLEAGIQVGHAWVTIDYAARHGIGNATRYKWTIFGQGFEYSGDDLQSGQQGGGLREGMGSLLSFLGAFAEALRHPLSENRDLFPAELADWASEHSDEFSMLALEIEETEDCIVE